MTPLSETHSDESPDQKGGAGGSVAVFTMREAAQVAGVSVSTLRRRRGDLVAAGAVIDPAGWKVPITALIAAGLIPGEGQHDTPTTGTPRTASGPGPAVSSGLEDTSRHEHELRRLQERVQELVEEVGHWRRRAEVAEARAEERGRSLETLRIANESERLALRMLTSQHTPTTTPEPPADAPPTPPEDTGPAHAPGQQEAPATERGQNRRGGFLRRLFTD